MVLRGASPPEGRTRSTLSPLLRERKSGAVALCTAPDGPQPGDPDQRAARVNQPPIAAEGPARVLVGRGHSRLGCEQRPRAGALDLEVERGLGKSGLAEVAELDCLDSAQTAGRLPEAADPAEHEFVRRFV